MQKDSIIIYRSFYEAIKDLPKELQADAWQSIFEYGLNDNEQDLSGIVSTVFKLIKPQLDANKKRFENGQKGGRPKTETKPNHNQTETKHKPNKNVNVNLNKNNNLNENKNNNNKELTNVSNDPTIEQIFEWFWNAYQKVGVKKIALSAFKKLNKTDMIQIKEHLPKYLDNHHRNGKMQFLPHFSTYLNQRRWENKLPYEDNKEKINNWGN